WMSYARKGKGKPMSKAAVRSPYITREDVAKLCEIASYAPSGANRQPWRVRVSGNRLTLMVDPKLAGNMIDPGGLVSLLELGAFAQNLALASEAMGYFYRISWLSFNQLTDRIATFEITGKRSSSVVPTLFYF